MTQIPTGQLNTSVSERIAWDRVGLGFHDFLNHELRTPLTAAGTALQTLALHLERSGGPSRDLLEVALRNIRRLELAVEWATDYVGSGQRTTVADGSSATVLLTDLLEDLDDLDATVPLSWSTSVGPWHAAVTLPREAWRRLLSQVMGAFTQAHPDAGVHLDIATVTSGDDQDLAGLLLKFRLPLCDEAAGHPAEVEACLRRQLSFAVHLDLSRELRLRHDLTTTNECLRLRILVPMSIVPPIKALQTA